MTRPLLLVVVLLATVLPLAAQQQTTENLYVTLLTSIQMPMKMPGMANMPQMPGMPTGAPAWSIDARATYPGAPVEPIFLGVPADLKLPDNKLVLHVPKPPEAKPGEAGQGGPGGKTPDMEMIDKLYWHPDEAEGPVVQTVKLEGGKMPGMPGMPGMSMPDLNRMLAERFAHEADGSDSKLPANLKGAGDYVLNTGGTATLDGFLPPLKMIQPDVSKIVPEEGFTFQWEAVPGARGYLASVIGMSMDQGDEDGKGMKMSTTSWYSTLVQPPLRIRGGYRQETTIADDLAKGILLPGNTTSCKVPAGMFEDVMMLRIKVEAVGNDFYSKAGGTTVFGTIRSEWNAMVFVMPGGAGGEE